MFPNPRSPTPPSRPGFTLIELLVVVVIIATLVGLLLPALASGRASSRATVCGSNLKQLAQAAMGYAPEHGGRFPPGASTIFVYGSGKRPVPDLERWHGRRARENEPFDPSRGPLAEYLGGDGMVKQCPSFQPDNPNGFEAGCGGYGYNNEYVGRESGTVIDVGARVDVFAQPVATVFFADTAFAQPAPGGGGGGGGGDAYLIEYSFVEPAVWSSGFSAGQPTDPSMHFRHRESASVAWLDGHIDRQTMSYTRANVYGVSEARNRQMHIGNIGDPDNNALFDRE
ncbi:MAG: prepilin-type N-terminal cleavage/methylation domain-containing protein [Phycisphaeraceae bacterium]|nr:prepilin-type N-terminal cleavage/methylation domain-containing protein [Phycisphaeraceae bacterium]